MLVSTFIALVAVYASYSELTAQSPLLINYQGHISAGSAADLESVDLQFILVDGDDDAAAELWHDAHSAIPVHNGNFSVHIGSGDHDSPLTDSLFANAPQLWLEVYIEGQRLSPRSRLIGVPYAIRSHSSASADSAKYAETSALANHSSTANALIDDFGESAIAVLDTGKIGVGIDDPDETLHVNGAVRAAPVCGRWRVSNGGTAAPSDFEWEPYFISRDAYFVQPESHLIQFEVAGYYSINVNAYLSRLDSSDSGDIDLYRNDEIIASTRVYNANGTVSEFNHGKGVMAIVEQFNAGDQIRVNLHIWLDGSDEDIAIHTDSEGVWSSLDIYRLN